MVGIYGKNKKVIDKDKTKTLEELAQEDFTDAL
jgi:hypothetical protein